MGLTTQQCTACRGGEPLASDADIQAWRKEIPDWILVEEDGIEKLQRSFRFDDFQQALAFTDKVGELAEQQQHHPAIITEWGKVAVIWWTHKIGGLHKNDFICAALTEQLTAD